MTLARSLRSAARDPRTGFFIDFDGTLSQIVSDPAAARPVRGARPALRALVAAGANVFVLSGRPPAFLARVLAVPGVTYAGLYGAEERAGRTTRTDPAVVDARPAVEAAVKRLRLELTGVHVEDKGFAVAVHARRSRDPAAALKRARPVMRALSKELGLGAVMPGRLVLEMGARGAPTKGTTLARICARERLKRVVVAGDDAGDLAMFEAAKASVPNAITIWVSNPEAPDPLAAAADHMVASQADLVSLLRAATL